MDVRAAVAWEAGKPLTIETVQLEGPRAGEVLVEVKATLARLAPALEKSRLPLAAKAQAQLMANQAADIVTSVEKDHSWGVHAPAFTLKKVKEAKLLAEAALTAMDGTRAQARK